MKLTNQLIILVFLILITLLEIDFFLYNLSGVDQIRHLSWVYFLSILIIFTFRFLKNPKQFIMTHLVLFMNY